MITRDEPLLISDLIVTLYNTFSLKHLGEVNCFLGLEAHVSPHSQSITLTKSKYIKEILLKDNLTPFKPYFTLLCSSDKLSSVDSPLFEHPYLYRRIIGALQYLNHWCSPISYSYPS